MKTISMDYNTYLKEKIALKEKYHDKGFKDGIGAVLEQIISILECNELDQEIEGFERLENENDKKILKLLKMIKSGDYSEEEIEPTNFLSKDAKYINEDN